MKIRNAANQGIMAFVNWPIVIPLFLQITNMAVPTGGVMVPMDIRIPTKTPK